jgi:hypothetical protein
MKYKELFYVSIISILFSFNLINKNPIKSIVDTSFSLKDAPLQVSTKLLTSEESQSILKYDLTDKGYKPVEVTISNSGSHTYEISRASTSLACATPKEVAWKATRGSIPRGIGLKILGFFFWPLAIPSAIDTVYTVKKHRSIVSILTAKGFKDQAEAIPPYSLVKRILYIPEDQFIPTFTLSLEDLTEDDLVVIPVTCQPKGE